MTLKQEHRQTLEDVVKLVQREANAAFSEGNGLRQANLKIVRQRLEAILQDDNEQRTDKNFAPPKAEKPKAKAKGKKKTEPKEDRPDPFEVDVDSEVEAIAEMVKEG